MLVTPRHTVPFQTTQLERAMTHRAMWFCIAAIALGTSAAATADTFLLVPGAPGDITENGHGG
jgi:hypothetical protein